MLAPEADIAQMSAVSALQTFEQRAANFRNLPTFGFGLEPATMRITSASGWERASGSFISNH